jgi:ATP-binding cassette subfamily C protein CydD
MKPVDPRLLRHATAARAYLAVAVALGVVTTGMVLAQAELLARLLAGAARGSGPAAYSAALIVLLAVVAIRAAE